MRRFAVLLALGSFAAAPLGVQGEPLAVAVLRGPGEKPAEAKRGEVIAMLKKELRQAETHEERIQARAALVRLGDQETVSTLFEAFASSKSREERAQLGEVLLLAKSPAPISRLAQYIFLDDRLEHVNQDTEGMACKSSISSRLMVSLLSACPEFSPRTRRSADRAAEAPDRELRDRLRAWWPANRDEFVRGDYARVGPVFQ